MLLSQANCAHGVTFCHFQPYRKFASGNGENVTGLPLQNRLTAPKSCSSGCEHAFGGGGGGGKKTPNQPLLSHSENSKRFLRPHHPFLAPLCRSRYRKRFTRCKHVEQLRRSPVTGGAWSRGRGRPVPGRR